MGDPDRRFGLVDMLAAGARGAIGVDLEIGLVDLEVRFLGDRKHGDGCGRRVDSPLGLGRRDALTTMYAALELEPGENAASRNLGYELLEASGRALARRQNFDLPALPLGVFDV